MIGTYADTLEPCQQSYLVHIKVQQANCQSKDYAKQLRYVLLQITPLSDLDMSFSISGLYQAVMELCMVYQHYVLGIDEIEFEDEKKNPIFNINSDLQCRNKLQP